MLGHKFENSLKYIWQGIKHIGPARLGTSLVIVGFLTYLVGPSLIRSPFLMGYVLVALGVPVGITLLTRYLTSRFR